MCRYFYMNYVYLYYHGDRTLIQDYIYVDQRLCYARSLNVVIYILCIYLAGSKPGELYIYFYIIIPGANNVCVFGSQLPVNSQPAPRFLYIISMQRFTVCLLNCLLKSGELDVYFTIKAATLLDLGRVVWSVEQALALINTCDHTIQISHCSKFFVTRTLTSIASDSDCKTSPKPE